MPRRPPPNLRVPQGAERRAKTKLWYEENSPGQKRRVDENNLPTEASREPILEVRDFGEPELICLQLDRNIISQGGNAKIVAEVTYGVGGASDTFVCDWADGTQMGIVAQRLTVVARPEQAVKQAAFSMSGLALELVASVGKRNPSVIQPTYTVGVDPLLPTLTSASFTPPAFAKAASFLAFDTTGADAYPSFKVRQSVIGAPWGEVFGEYLAGGAAMPLAPEANITIINRSATATLLMAIIWHLCL